jgi:hypothetical protein
LGFGEVKRKGSEVVQREKQRGKKKSNKNRDILQIWKFFYYGKSPAQLSGSAIHLFRFWVGSNHL